MAQSLIVVGSGIKFMSHLTIETKASIEQADNVLYLVNEPAIEKWIQQTSINSESLTDLYYKYDLRQDSYRAITERILSDLCETKTICVVIYGHPCVYAQPALDAVKIAQSRGYTTKVLPGISAEDCLLADLLINPGAHGCQSFEATDLLICKRVIDSTSHLLIWQAGMLGSLGHNKESVDNTAMKVFFSYLNQYYDADKEVVIYTAAQYPGFEPIIEVIKLFDLPKSNISRLATLYISPAKKPTYDPNMLELFNIKINDLKGV